MRIPAIDIDPANDQRVLDAFGYDPARGQTPAQFMAGQVRRFIRERVRSESALRAGAEAQIAAMEEPDAV